jgi:phage replication initiation protein
MKSPYTDKVAQAFGFNKTAFGSKIWTDASAPPKSSNEGGTTAAEYATASQTSTDPRLVIRGESFNHNTPISAGGESHELVSIGGKAVVISTPLPKQDGNSYAAITDFLNCTFPYKSPDIELLFFDLAECLGKAFTPFTDRNKGLHGWKNSIQLGESKTFLAYGGQNDTVFLSIPGEGCHMVPSWKNLLLLIRDKYQGKITRWDGAVDDYEGVHSVDVAVQLYKDDQFNAGGRKPECNQHGNWITPNGSGRTFEVGQRENGKMIRIYEKGMQLGRKFDPWVRWEVEMHSVDRVIPWEVLLEPGKYVAGAYPNALGWVHEDMRRIKTIQKTADICYESQKHYAKLSYGKLINTMLEVEGSAQKVVDELLRDGIPKSLNLPIVDKNEGWSK